MNKNIKKVERINFGYVWIGSRSEKERGIDRIKRAVFKNEYMHGGLNMTDVDCLNSVPHKAKLTKESISFLWITISFLEKIKQGNKGLIATMTKNPHQSQRILTKIISNIHILRIELTEVRFLRKHQKGINF